MAEPNITNLEIRDLYAEVAFELFQVSPPSPYPNDSTPSTPYSYSSDDDDHDGLSLSK